MITYLNNKDYNIFMNHIKKASQIMIKLGHNVKKAIDKSKGSDHKIVLLYTDKGNYVYRYCDNDKAIMSHAYAINKWSNLGFPKLIIKKKCYLIETMIPGKDMSESKLTSKQKLKIMKKLGKIMKKMHETKTRRYGYLIKPGIGQVNSWNKYILRLTRRRMKTLNDDLVKRIEKYLKNNSFEFGKPALLHKDINPENIMTYNGELSGIIDAADAVSGDPLYDIAIVYDRFRKWDKKYPDALVKAYGPVNQKRLRYYFIINLIRRIWLRKTQKKTIEVYIQKLDILLKNEKL